MPDETHAGTPRHSRVPSMDPARGREERVVHHGSGALQLPHLGVLPKLRRGIAHHRVAADCSLEVLQDPVLVSGDADPPIRRPVRYPFLRRCSREVGRPLVLNEEADEKRRHPAGHGTTRPTAKRGRAGDHPSRRCYAEEAPNAGIAGGKRHVDCQVRLDRGRGREEPAAPGEQLKIPRQLVLALAKFTTRHNRTLTHRGPCVGELERPSRAQEAWSVGDVAEREPTAQSIRVAVRVREFRRRGNDGALPLRPS
jgi:hypothetical protein